MGESCTCCFTGHRPAGMPWGSNEMDSRCLELKYQLAKRLEKAYEAGYRHFICGMAQGADLYFAEAVLAMKEHHPEISLEAAVPCRDQAKSWDRAQQERREHILSLCDKATVLQESYSPGCMQRRNKYMVDSSSRVISAFSGSTGGTMSTLLYATRQGKETDIIDI